MQAIGGPSLSWCGRCKPLGRRLGCLGLGQAVLGREGIEDRVVGRQGIGGRQGAGDGQQADPEGMAAAPLRWAIILAI